MRKLVDDDSDNDVSLFPFLSIIAAIIGVLTLMIAAITLDQMNQGDSKQIVANAIRSDKLRTDIKEQEEKIRTIRLSLSDEDLALLENAENRENEIVKTKIELEALLKELKETQEELDTQKEVEIVAPEIPPGSIETLADLRLEHSELQKRVDTLKKEVGIRKAETEGSVKVLPGGTGLNVIPHFVECTEGAIVLHGDKEATRIRQAEILSDSPYKELLQTVVNKPGHAITFLLRHDGLQSYREAKRMCDQNSVKYGKLPIVGDGRLDFTNFNKR